MLPTVTVQGISHSSTKYSTHTNSNKTKQNSTCTSHTLSHKSHFSLDSLYQRHGKKPKGRKKNRKELFKSEKQLSIQSVDLVISYHSERDAATNKTKNYIQTPADFVLLNPVLFSSSFSFIFSKFFVLFIFSYFVRIVYWSLYWNTFVVRCGTFIVSRWGHDLWHCLIAMMNIFYFFRSYFYLSFDSLALVNSLNRYKSIRGIVCLTEVLWSCAPPNICLFDQQVATVLIK